MFGEALLLTESVASVMYAKSDVGVAFCGQREPHILICIMREPAGSALMM